MIYIIIASFLILLTFLYDFSNLKGGENFFYSLSWLIFILLFGLRYRVGGDTLNYMLVYDAMPTFTELLSGNINVGNGKLQPLWLLFCATAKLISNDFTVLQLLHAIFINTIIFRFIRKNTKYYFTGILLYFLFYSFYFNMEILRESLAVSIFLLSIKHFIKHKWLKYYLLVTIAFLFHYTAIILFFLPFFRSLEINKKTILFLSIYFILGFFISGFLIKIITMIVGKGGLYYSMEAYFNYKLNLFGFISIVIVNILFPILIYYYSKKSGIQPKHQIFLFFYIAIGFSVSYFSIFFRFMNYFTPILCLFLTELLHTLFRQVGTPIIRLKFSVILFIFFSLFFIPRYFSDTSKYVRNSRWISHWYPYYSILDKKVDDTREKLHKAENRHN